MDEVAKEILGEVTNVPWCMMSADDEVLVGENRVEVNQRLDE